MTPHDPHLAAMAGAGVSLLWISCFGPEVAAVDDVIKSMIISGKLFDSLPFGCTAERSRASQQGSFTDGTRSLSTDGAGKGTAAHQLIGTGHIKDESRWKE